MEKTLIGTWGAVLGDQDYAFAIAELGIAGPRSSPSILETVGETTYAPYFRWGASLLDLPDDHSARDWFATAAIDASTAASRWKPHTCKLSIPSRLHILSFLPSPDNLFETLARALPRTLIVEPAEEASASVTQRSWNWPLRLGVFPGLDVTGLQAQFDGETSPGLFPLVELDGRREVCDVLLLSEPGITGSFPAGPPGGRTRARATVVLTSSSLLPNAESVREHAAYLRDTYRSSAVVLLPTPITPSLTAHFLRELSHNKSCDEAAFDALAGAGVSGTPYILGMPGQMEQMRLRNVAHRYDRILRRSLPSSYHVRGLTRSTPTEWQHSDGTARTLPGDLMDDFERRGYLAHETQGAFEIAQTTTAADTFLDRQRVPRWLHAQCFSQQMLARDSTAGLKVPQLPANAANRVERDGALLVLRVSPTLEGPRAQMPLDESDLDFTSGSVLLHVLLELSGATILPLPWTPRSWEEILDPRFVAQLPQPTAMAIIPAMPATAGCPLELPEAGDSSLAAFWIAPAKGVDEIVGRVTLLHRNRAVQTVRLKLLVRQPVAAPSEAEQPAEPVLNADPDIRGRMDDLADMRDFDATILVSDDLSMGAHALLQSDGRQVQLPLSHESVSSPTKSIVDALTLVTRRSSSEDVIAVDSPTVVESLYRLASHGSLLHNKLPEWIRSRSIRRIQVITRGDTYFPAEFIYEGPAPDPNDSSLCENAASALASGDCGTCPNKLSSKHHCPMHFWGLSRTIERHSSVPSTRSDQPPAACGSRPSAARTPFGELSPVLHGVANRAYDFRTRNLRVPELTAALEKLAGANLLKDSNSWELWRTGAMRNPKIFVAIPHSEDNRGVPVLELGENDLLQKAQIVSANLFAATPEPRLLLLLGCSLADSRESFAPYPQEFRAAGADIVVAPLAPILGADSVPIATAMAGLLQETTAASGRRTLGELMTALRRRSLLAGHPGALSVVAYGDADWVFGK